MGEADQASTNWTRYYAEKPVSREQAAETGHSHLRGIQE